MEEYKTEYERVLFITKIMNKSGLSMINVTDVIRIFKMNNIKSKDGSEFPRPTIRRMLNQYTIDSIEKTSYKNTNEYFFSKLDDYTGQNSIYILLDKFRENND